MNETEPATTTVQPKSTPTAAKWTGRVLSGLVGLAFLASAVGKFVGGAGLEEGFAHLGLPIEIQYPLAVLELVVAIIYLIPQTAVLGAILLTGYIGGAICTHWRVGDVFIVQIIIGVLVWLGVFLRDRRLWVLLPLRA
ncbi:DoxX family protein [Blastopirellula marina]|uniref:DoxX family protein n=1 Tax=Blastopirellula marina TaxID=124 RepID=A0A2S8F7G5_9BACT|nr:MULTISPECIES: DoxX family protein [Pirellulaceae]PQO28096.1 DoxX family protein [Blastopirellula marina]RCS48522.1 DoxX family protein [Bremerella cremea]